MALTAFMVLILSILLVIGALAPSYRVRNVLAGGCGALTGCLGVMILRWRERRARPFEPVVDHVDGHRLEKADSLVEAGAGNVVLGGLAAGTQALSKAPGEDVARRVQTALNGLRLGSVLFDVAIGVLFVHAIVRWMALDSSLAQEVGAIAGTIGLGGLVAAAAVNLWSLRSWRESRGVGRKRARSERPDTEPIEVRRVRR